MKSKILGHNTNWQKFVRSHTLYAWLLIAPAALFLILIVGWPLVETVRLSFTDAGLGGEKYIGWQNFEKLFNSRKYPGIVGRTFYWMFLSVSLKMILGYHRSIAAERQVKGKECLSCNGYASMDCSNGNRMYRLVMVI
ncbi:MAG: hypothetical protein Ct9H300mP28_01780 [Pseudomonadota bacterium]|nr:MAG: hypothetical protein Ct9H300mP28_01780 [Pseudomonadota bacterium]